MDSLQPDTLAVIRDLSLVPHPEGGYYRETWASAARVSTPRGERAAFTVIHFLLPGGAVSAFHRVQSDELWHHAGGDPIDLHILEPSGGYAIHRVGPLGPPGTLSHQVVPAGAWQAARPLGSGHALLTCIVAPGFHFGDFEMADAEVLVRLRPDLADTLRALCLPAP